MLPTIAAMTTLLHDTAPAGPDRLDTARIDTQLDRHGFATHHVTGDTTRPSWSHSIGLDRFGHPELVVVGVTAEAGDALIHWVVDLLRGGERLAVGRDHRHAFRGVPIRVVPVPEQCWDPSSDLLGACRAGRAGRASAPGPVAALQVVWADGDGRFPWEADFDAGLHDLQPLLAHRWSLWQRA